jgi:hypothetical protein
MSGGFVGLGGKSRLVTRRDLCTRAGGRLSAGGVREREPGVAYDVVRELVLEECRQGGERVVGILLGEEVPA